MIIAVKLAKWDTFTLCPFQNISSDNIVLSNTSESSTNALKVELLEVHRQH